MKRRHAVQPSLPQLRGGAVGLGQSVVKVNQLLLVNLMNLIANRIEDEVSRRMWRRRDGERVRERERERERES